MEIRQQEKEQLRQEVIEYFTSHTNDTRVAIFKRSKKYRHLYNFILEETKEFSDIPLTTRIYFVVSNKHEYRKCEVCGKDIPHDRSCNPLTGYSSYNCSVSCAQLNPKTQETIRATNLKKYGVEHPQQLPEARKRASEIKLNKTSEEKAEVQQKRQKTCVKKYGVDHVAKVKEFKEKQINSFLNRTEEEKQLSRVKRMQTSLEKYGVKDYTQAESVKQKSEQTCLKHFGVKYYLQSNDCKKKTKEHCLKTYGVEYYSQTKDIQEKIHKTSLEKYGVDHFTQAESVKEKNHQTCIERYGVDNILQEPNNRKHIRETCIEKYGGPSPLCSHEIRAKARKKYHYNNISFDSYPELCYYIWLTDHNVLFIYHPNTPIVYQENGRNKKYWPDFLVNGKFHEIKGDLWWENASEIKKRVIVENTEKILFKSDYLPLLKYVEEKFGEDFFEKCKE